jgi:hypothetical protein
MNVNSAAADVLMSIFGLKRVDNLINNDKVKPNRKSLTDKKCKICKGTGWHRYDHNLMKACASCCTHDKGWWKLTRHYEGYEAGTDNSCCLAGCGTMKRNLLKEHEPFQITKRPIKKTD